MGTTPTTTTTVTPVERWTVTTPTRTFSSWVSSNTPTSMTGWSSSLNTREFAFGPRTSRTLCTTWRTFYRKAAIRRTTTTTKTISTFCTTDSCQRPTETSLSASTPTTCVVKSTEERLASGT